MCDIEIYLIDVPIVHLNPSPIVCEFICKASWAVSYNMKNMSICYFAKIWDPRYDNQREDDYYRLFFKSVLLWTKHTIVIMCFLDISYTSNQLKYQCI
jgi:hypothetical protein